MNSSSMAAPEPRVFSVEPGGLAHARARVSAEDKRVKPAFAALLKEANKALKLQPPSVMEKPKAGASGDRHDYYSTAPYYWPDPAKPDGLPYLRKDGQRNPESGGPGSDAPRLARMADAAATLALASWLTGQESYAEQAARLVRVWFLEPATRMNPNFNQAQATPGINEGRGTGMIESRNLLSVLDAAGLLAGSRHWSHADDEGLRSWMQQFLDWTQTSKNGRHEQAARNNHGTFYDMQVTHLALFTGHTNLARQIVEAAKTNRMAVQIQPDGSQPLELARVDSFGYSRFNLEAYFALATLGTHVGVDLWHYQTADGASLAKALDFLLPYVEDPEKPWPYEKGKKQDRHLDALLRQAHAVYGDTRYRDVLHQSPGQEREREALFFPVK